MNSKKRVLITFLTILGSLVLIFCVLKTNQLYFSQETNSRFSVDNLEASKTEALAIPKLKMFGNEKLQTEKIKPELNSAEDNEPLENNQQILTHKYLIKVLSQQQNFLRRCFENHLRTNPNSTEKGTIVVEFMVLPFGEIRDVEIKDSNFNDKTFENCIQTVFLRTQVKKFQGEKFLITFPLEFE